MYVLILNSIILASYANFSPINRKSIFGLYLYLSIVISMFKWTYCAPFWCQLTPPSIIWLPKAERGAIGKAILIDCLYKYTYFILLYTSEYYYLCRWVSPSPFSNSSCLACHAWTVDFGKRSTFCVLFWERSDEYYMSINSTVYCVSFTNW